jgi:hypothetical protein
MLKVMERGGVYLCLSSRKVTQSLTVAGVNPYGWTMGMGVDLIAESAWESDAFAPLSTTGADFS